MTNTTKAMILSAGLGTRMGELTKNMPKPLLKANNQSLIEYHLFKLAHAGITDCLINTYQFSEKFLSVLGDGKKYGLNITYSKEKEVLGTAGGIVKALSFFSNENFILINGDVYTDYDVKKLAHFKFNKNILAHLILTDNPEHHQQGDFYLDNNKVNSISGKKLTYTGMAVYQPKLFENLSVGYKELGTLLREAIKNHVVSGEHYNGVWISVDTPERLALAETLASTQQRF